MYIHVLRQLIILTQIGSHGNRLHDSAVSISGDLVKLIIIDAQMVIPDDHLD